MARLDVDANLTNPQRKRYAAAIRTICKILARAADAVPADLDEVSVLLAHVPPAVHGRSRKTIANVRSQLKGALLNTSGRARLPRRGTPLSPAWAALREQIADNRRLSNGLTRLMRVASHEGLAPEDVCDGSFERLAQIVGESNWGRDEPAFRRNVPVLWNEAGASVPGWPSGRLTPPKADPRPTHLPMTALAATFQRDVESYLTWAACGDLFATDVPTRPLKASTLHLRREQLRIAASTLARHLGNVEQVPDLATLVRPENVKTILTAFHNRSGTPSFSTFARGLYLTLHSVAKAWVRPNLDQLAELSALKRFLGSEPIGLTKRTRTMLRQFDDDRVVADLLALPDRLRRAAVTRPRSTKRRLQQVRVALAIDILLVAPIRLQNLVSLELDRQLQWPNGRSGTVYIVLEQNETKNEQALEYPLPERVRHALHEYLDRYRSPGRPTASASLFLDDQGRPVAACTLRDGIIKAVKRELGVTITPHQFRHLAAKIALDAQPGALGFVQSLLGHKSPKTTQRAYAGMRTREAGRFYDELLSTRRPASPKAR